MNISVRSLLLLAILLVSPASAQKRRLEPDRSQPPEQRVALVIGNSAYVVGRLRNPINDARAMAQVLRELGFQVIHREDLNQTDMKRSIKEFGEKIKRGGVGLFYYAGHGVQVRGENYLIPVNAAPESAEEVKYEAVNAGVVLAQMANAGNGMNIVILDACRNNPFTRSFRSTSEGLAAINAPSGTLIAYATAPGSVAKDGGSSGNGIYTQELLQHIRVPGLSIEEVFKRVRIGVRNRTQDKQTPWEESSLTGDFYFTRSKASNDGLPKAGTPNSMKPASPKILEGTPPDIGNGGLSKDVQLVSYNNETALAFRVHHIHGGLIKGKACHGLLYVTPTRIIFEPTDKTHALDQPRTQIKESKAGNVSFFSETPHILLKYGNETKRFRYSCKNEKAIPVACGYTIPSADYLFNLTAIDFDAAVKKFQVFARTKD